MVCWMGISRGNSSDDSKSSCLMSMVLSFSTWEP
jgi:hypothetical protein